MSFSNIQHGQPAKASATIRADRTPVRGITRIVYVMLAAMFLGLGLLGVLLPGLPTTPFLLLMSYLLLRAWPQMHERVIRMPIVGNTIRAWDEQRGVNRHTKILAYVMVLGVVAITFVSPAMSAAVKAIIVVLAAIELYVVWRLATI